MTHDLGNGATMQLARWIANLAWRDLPVDRIAAVVLDIEHHSARQLIDLDVPVPGARAAA